MSVFVCLLGILTHDFLIMQSIPSMDIDGPFEDSDGFKENGSKKRNFFVTHVLNILS